MLYKTQNFIKTEQITNKQSFKKNKKRLQIKDFGDYNDVQNIYHTMEEIGE